MLLGAAILVVLAIALQRQIVGLFSAPTPAEPPNEVLVCGEEVAGHSGPLNVAARECFWSAYQQRRPAQFQTTRPTIEGDPVTWTYSVRADGVVELTIDSRRDRFSNGEITVLECRALVRLDDPILPDAVEFGPGDDCVERGAS